jgi:hypothetical protein
MVDCIHLTQDRDQSWALANMVIDLLVPQNTRNLVS